MHKSKDEQCCTWMDWIWSSMCLELLCTFTQSNNLKWVSGGGINSPRHQTSRWLTATEKDSVGWTDAYFSQASVHPMPLPRHIAVEILWHNCSDAMHRRSVGSSGAEDPATKSSLLASTRPSDRPTLPLDQGVGSFGAEGSFLALSVLFQTKRRIDRRCPHLDRRIIRFIRGCTNACDIDIVDSSDGVFFLLFLRVFNLDLCFNLTYLTCHYL
jgi:hypothetical protein